MLEKLATGGITTVVGLVVVFSMLVLLIGIIQIFKNVAKVILRVSEAKAVRVQKKQKSKTNKKQAVVEEKAEKKKVAAPTVVSGKEMPSAPAQDGELIAVLTAAAACMMQVPANQVRIASYQKQTKRRASSWAMAGRREQITRF